MNCAKPPYYPVPRIISKAIEIATDDEPLDYWAAAEALGLPPEAAEEASEAHAIALMG